MQILYGYFWKYLGGAFSDHLSENTRMVGYYLPEHGIVNVHLKQTFNVNFQMLYIFPANYFLKINSEYRTLIALIL